MGGSNNSMSEHKLILFDTTAWLSNSKLCLAPYTIKGVWIDLMSHMAQSEKYGYLIIAGNTLSKEDIKELLNFNKDEDFEKVWKLLVEKYKILKYDAKENAYFSSRMVADYNKHHLNIHYELPGLKPAETGPLNIPVLEPRKQPSAPIQKTQNIDPKKFVAPTIEQVRVLFTQIKQEEGTRATYDIDKVTADFFKAYTDKNWIIRKLPPANIKDECRKWVFKSFVKDDELNTFEKARQAYPGMKNGLLFEFKNFQKQKDYREVIELLVPAIEKQKKWRERMKQVKGQFVPEWKFFTTWINQRCWEQEMPKVENSSSHGDGPIRAKG